MILAQVDDILAVEVVLIDVLCLPLLFPISRMFQGDSWSTVSHVDHSQSSLSCGVQGWPYSSGNYLLRSRISVFRTHPAVRTVAGALQTVNVHYQYRGLVSGQMEFPLREALEIAWRVLAVKAARDHQFVAHCRTDRRPRLGPSSFRFTGSPLSSWDRAPTVIKKAPFSHSFAVVHEVVG
jgi:hypothetical protein